MNIDSLLKKSISDAFKAAFDAELDISEIGLQQTRKEFVGSHTLVTFPYARLSKKNPEETGKILGEYLVKNIDEIKSFNVVKGFLNIELSDTVWLSLIAEILDTPHYGIHPPSNKKVLVEFSSPNTNKPLHLGHLRNNFLGHSISQILVANGYDVSMSNLVNDRGIHICKSMLAYIRYGNGETPESSQLKGDHLAGKYYVKFDQEYKKEIEQLVTNGMEAEQAKKKAPILLEAQEMLQKWEANDPEVIALWKQMNGWVYDGFNKSYETMGIHFDKYYYESETYLLGKDIVEEGLEKGVFFKKDDGSVWVDLTDEGMDEKLVLRADGTSVYITQDMGTADLKYGDFKFEKSVYVVGNEQDYHFKVLFSILKKLGRSYANGLYHLSYGMVDLPSGKMKSREGTVVDADDLMQEMLDTAEQHTKELGKVEGFDEAEAKELYRKLGLGAVKFYLLRVDPKKRILFNPQESVEFQGFTAPFIQYTFARISSILRRAKQLGIETNAEMVKTQQQLAAEEIDLIKVISDYPTKIALAGENMDPAVIAQYAYDLAKEYNRFYTVHSIFKEEDTAVMAMRIALSSQAAKTIESAMLLLGIKVPERM